MKKQEEIYFHHALKVLDDVCIGCTHCMSVCPTQAIRVRNGIARILDNRCVDCGECYNACPVNAIIVEQDDFEEIQNFKVRVALVPGVLIGQFPEKIRTEELYQALLDLGFTHVYEVENTAGFVLDGFEKEIEGSDKKPMISSFCPAVIRLIQVRFPSLTDQIMRIKPPIDISAVYYREKLESEGYYKDEIGIFYVTPCAAKIAAVKSPVGESDSQVDGVINMKFLFNRISRILKNGKKSSNEDLQQELLSREGILWSLTNGEVSNVKRKSLAIDGIHNVSAFLDKLENEEFDNIDFLEMRACDQSCAGGILVSGNRFLTAERLRKRSVSYPKLKDKALHLQNAPQDNRLGHIKARPIEKLDEDMEKAMRKMDRKRRLMCYLPGIDCGACGAPDCVTLAEDIVQGKADVSSCVFLQQNMVNRGALSIEQANKITSKIWGKNRFDKDCSKPGAKNEDN
ncbi:MAG: [Fe-Fe] hydrogenase large subunit C-terminal domain-containing protein [Bacteroidales bacterium]